MIEESWDDFILSQNPEVFATYTFPRDFFKTLDGEMVRRIDVSGRESATHQAIRGFLYHLSRKTKQHIRMFYGTEETMGESSKHSVKRTNKNTHTHGLMCFEYGAYRVAEYSSSVNNCKIGDIGHMMSQLWGDYLFVEYGVKAHDSRRMFQLFDRSLAKAGSYSCFKHTSGDLVMDICPRHRNICKKGKGVCAFKWDGNRYE